MKKLLAVILCIIILSASLVCFAEDALPEFPIMSEASVKFGLSPSSVKGHFIGIGGGGVLFKAGLPDDAKVVSEPRDDNAGNTYITTYGPWNEFDGREATIYYFFDADDKLYQMRITYKDTDPESFVMTNDTMIAAYGETAFNDVTGLTLPLPPVDIAQFEASYTLTPPAFTSLEGQPYELPGKECIIHCEAWHQWLIPYGDTFVVIDHVYYRYYKDAETPAYESPREMLTFTLLNETERDYLIENMNEMSEN